MRPVPGPRPAEVHELARVSDRISFLYLERATVHRDGNAITVTDEQGVVHVPAAQIATLLLGPGISITHQAMLLLADSGTGTVWVGEHGVRYYAHGRPLARTSRHLQAQVAAWSNQSSRLRVARAMYELRFPGEDVSRLTMQQLRGREGARVRKGYREHARACGLEWSSRRYAVDDFGAGDLANQAVSAATACLYGLAHAAIVSMGCSPALGFIHTGHDRSFVFDVADLYKMDLAVPVAFRVAADDPPDLPAEVRRAMRDAIHDAGLLAGMVKDIHRLLGTGGEADHDYADVVTLWGRHGEVAAGHNFASDEVPW